MKNILITLSIIICAATVQAQPALNTIKVSDLKKDLYALADAHFRGRSAGTIDELKASMWLGEQYRALGLLPAGDDGSYFQYFNMWHNHIADQSTISINNQSLALWKDVTVAQMANAQIDAPILYLGDGFLSTVIASYLLGPIIGIAHWMVYRRYKPQQKCSTFSVYLTLFILFLASLFSYSLYFKKIQIDHIPKSTSYVITEEDWWNKQSYIFPSYSTNRFGHQKSPLNIQYMGSLHKLQHALEKSGWKQQPDSFFYSLLMRVEGEHPKEKIPLMAELYQNKKPILILSYRSKNKQPTLVLRFWRSNYYLEDNPQPIWFGSLNHLGESEGIKSQSITPYTLMLQGSHEFEFNQIRLGPSYDPSFSHSESEGILMM